MTCFQVRKLNFLMKWNWLIFLSLTHDIAISFGFEKTMKFNKLGTLGVGLEIQEIIPNYFGRKFLYSLDFRARK